MSQAPTIHVLDKADYSKHRLVTLPVALASSLAPSSLRFRPRILGQTTNNFTYARIGHLLGWYDIYPLPSNTPAPYNDDKTYGRVSAWGYAEIVESTVPGISPGQSLYGYLLISSGVEDVHVAFAEHEGKKVEEQIVVLDEHRQHLWKIYNRYQVCAPLKELQNTKGLDSLGWDALMQTLFGTSYNLSTYGFAWDDRNRINPSGKGDWTAADADLCNATVIVLNASGKTGMSFAYALRHNRPRERQPKTIVGVGSPASVTTVSQSGFYDEVVLSSDVETIVPALQTSGATKILLLDFGAREGANAAWKSALSASSIPFQHFTVGGEVCVQNPEKACARAANLRSSILINASWLREKGIESGGGPYHHAFYEAFDDFKTRVVGMRLKWGDGLEEWEKGWEALCKDEIRAATGLIYRI